MPPLKNIKHERYAQMLLSGKPQIEAYATIGGSPISGEASRLANSPEIVERLMELQNKAAHYACMDKAWVLNKLRTTALRAMKEADYSAATSALRLIGLELGMFSEKRELEVSIKRKFAIERLTPEMAASMTAALRALEQPGEDDEH